MMYFDLILNKLIMTEDDKIPVATTVVIVLLFIAACVVAIFG